MERRRFCREFKLAAVKKVLEQGLSAPISLAQPNTAPDPASKPVGDCPVVTTSQGVKRLEIDQAANTMFRTVTHRNRQCCRMG